ncbi:MAG: lipoprotein-releasing ABC transporter permease subunit [Asticcacaulis sp.]
MTGLFGFKLWELDLALRYLRTRRKDGGIAVIAIISFVGITLAVTALISVLSIMNGFRDELLSRTLAFNGDAYVYGHPLEDFAHRDDMLKRLRAVPGVTQVSPYVQSFVLAQGPGGRSGPGIVRGVEPAILQQTKIISDNIKSGSLAAFGKGDYGGDGILIGDGLAHDMGLVAGDSLSLLTQGGSTAFGSAPVRKSYTVLGIFKSGVSEFDNMFIYMPLAQAQLFLGREDEWDTVEIMVDRPDDIARFHEPLISAAGEGGLVEDWAQRNAPLWNALQVERTAMRFILSFIVIIATLNIVSGIVMLVKNKTRDVAILRTMGADRAAISRVFFLAGTMIGVGGTVSGLLLGVLFCANIRGIQQLIQWLFHVTLFDPNIYYLQYVPAKMEPGEVAFVAIGSLLAACISTFFPAMWASKLEPVEALRYE